MMRDFWLIRQTGEQSSIFACELTKPQVPQLSFCTSPPEPEIDDEGQEGYLNQRGEDDERQRGSYQEGW